MTNGSEVQNVPVEEQLRPYDPNAADMIDKPGAIERQFYAMLQDADKADGRGLSAVWEQCVKLHSDNTMLRVNMNQMQVTLQDWYKRMDEMRRILDEYLRAVEKTDPDALEKMRDVLKLNDKLIRTMTHITSTVRENKKEISRSELQERYYIHTNTMMAFFTAMTGILIKHLQSDPKKDAILADMRRLGQALNLCLGVGVDLDRDERRG